MSQPRPEDPEIEIKIERVHLDGAELAEVDADPVAAEIEVRLLSKEELTKEQGHGSYR